MSEKYCNADQFCDDLGKISLSTLNRYLKKPGFPQPIVLGRRRFWPKSEIDKYLTTQFEQANQ